MSVSAYSPFIELAEKIGMIAIDIGARGGVNSDLLPLAPAINFYGFEPDYKEFERMNSEKKTPVEIS